MAEKKIAFRNRQDFSKIPATIQIPNLIEVQKRSYDRFLQMDLLPSERDDAGLQAVFQSVFPITDFRNVSQLEFVDYAIGNWECKCGHLKGLHHLRTTCKNCGATVVTDPFHPGDVLCHKCGTFNANTPDFCNKCGDPVGLQLKYDVAECEERGMTYSAPLKVTMRLTIFDKDPETNNRTIRDIKEQEVFFGDVPLMTQNGTFIINGTERVIVSQLHRSPGVFFETANNRTYFLGKIIPYRGSWVEFEYDQKNILYVRIDRKRKFLGTIFLRALGLRTDEDILRTFYTVDRIAVKDKKLYWTLEPGIERPTNLVGLKLSHAIKAKNGEEVAHSGRKVTASVLKEIQKHKISELEIELGDLEGAYVASDVIDTNTGEVLLEANQELTADKLSKMIDAGIGEVNVFFPERDDVGTVISATLRRDSVKTPQEALIEIYRKLRPGDPPTLDTATALFHGMFFDARKYDFSRVGRLKFNIKLFDRQDPTGLDKRTLDPDDFYHTIRYLLKLRRNLGAVDDIDHLGNRRVRAVGELLENQFRIGLVRMERAIKEKMSVYQEMSTAMPHDLVNAKPVMAAIREFFGSSQLSQFMDQTNPLSEITHKRRLSALGPGGLSRERAGFEVRDVHPTHYGRICPIETPEGPNIGLISSLSCYARINDYGFIESPYRRVKGGRVIDYVQVTHAGDSDYRVGDKMEKSEAQKANEELRGRKKRGIELEPYSFYLSAWEEDKWTIAQANAELDEKGKITSELVNARKAGNFVLISRDDIDYIDVSPKQLVSVAASLVPFLEHDDANRALMGANMQRQSVPLLRAEAPIVGTGMEGVTARDSGAVVLARRSGIIDSVDSERVIVRVEGEHHPMQLSREVGSDIYQLTKFKRSNQNTCINQKPIVKQGDHVKKGQVIADGPCTDHGELGLGRNVLVSFMPWRGYNFEDAILVSEKLVKEDYYTSVHIEEFEIEARDTKLGPEEITRDIPNVSESALRDLDESGVIRIGAPVKAGDILVGKVTPKGETQLTPEEKLLRAIFGEKAGDVRDASLTCPPGIEGVVVDVKIFSRKGQEKDERAKQIEGTQIAKLEKNLADEIRILTDERLKRLEGLLGAKVVQADLHDERTNKRLLTKDAVLDRETIERISTRNLKRIKYADKDPRVNEQIDEIEEMTSRQIDVLRKIVREKIEKLQKGDELPPGVIKLVKVYIAMKRKLSVGDKMAGRHGNKGVIARILPEEDMPYLEDGTPVEIVLNPLGVPSRMNVGQILETHLGWAGHELGKKIAEFMVENSEAGQVRKHLKQLFKDTAFVDHVTELDDEMLLKVAKGMQDGVFFGSAVFDGSTEAEIKSLLDQAGLPTSGKTFLYDGMTGDRFEQPVTVGYIYMLKLSHLVDDKIHARSIGPYSLITQQPLGGKAQFGGQRFGEMEVWALEAYGAAYILQELLTAKSDDVYGRTKIYEAIVKGEAAIEPGVPESFNVLIRELQSLCLDVELIKTKEKAAPAPVAAD
ncbi:DNA-directed RNA polymerase subunit beta [Candidatus Koribacter versatilis Ellin345]|uniref:DNA-directed RNA polymerase subunit beta n=1 Tax=Koribacter versatilis (strain Ellin345) TaxID=204669 RepID=RPOB_KORVE|nr:DNA-directed RNA polymerase subunit beta [Candidatus Koribacter versatilis]Q1IHH4.1 RecName: Full=DNA-directed RNA polymerase subunit beta; Short=RNAP subunit beta; AltName: Full=RNA polymerase subunit beta; AltName: Full=Transcriptase subunit beta [Candidatus Koribacter versatilis Ellin345]ABF43676.1 DNA-directed RNA polymerase subunit beta [Candidatus Koribacter versatilis Ellin345]